MNSPIQDRNGSIGVILGIIVAVIILGIGSYGLLSRTESTSLYWIDVDTNSRFSVKVLVNGVVVTTAQPPRELFSSATVNEHLKNGVNKLVVEYEVLPVDSEYGEYGPETFTVSVKEQTDWKNPDTIQVLNTITGPRVLLPQAGTKGTETVSFVAVIP